MRFNAIVRAVWRQRFADTAPQLGLALEGKPSEEARDDNVGNIAFEYFADALSKGGPVQPRGDGLTVKREFSLYI